MEKILDTAMKSLGVCNFFLTISALYYFLTKKPFDFLTLIKEAAILFAVSFIVTIICRRSSSNENIAD